MDSIKATAKNDSCKIYRRPNIIGHRPPSTGILRYFYGMLINRCRLNPSWMLNIEHRPYMRMHINFLLVFFPGAPVPSVKRAYRLYSVYFFFWIILFQCCWPVINWTQLKYTRVFLWIFFFHSPLPATNCRLASFLSPGLHTYEVCVNLLHAKWGIIFEKWQLLLYMVYRLVMSYELWWIQWLGGSNIMLRALDKYWITLY